MLKSIKKQLQKAEKGPGIYIFRDKGNKIIYIGKAVNLRSRTRSYFSDSLNDERFLAPKIKDETKKIETIETCSELEAILLEAKLIRKNKPKYNLRQKDDKSFIYIYIDFYNSIPRVSFAREKELIEGKIKPKKKDKIFGPFVRSREIRKLMSYLRKATPYRDCSDTKFRKHQKLGRGCQWQEICRCDAPCIGNISQDDYRRKISQLSRLLSGRFKSIEKELEKEMKNYSKRKMFENAALVRNRLKTLKQIENVSLIEMTEERKSEKSISIEALDISNISGKSATGSIVRANVQMTNDKLQIKNQMPNIQFLKDGYRRFKIRGEQKPDDIAMIREVMRRRFKHKEWVLPDILLVDGGKSQLNAAIDELKKLKSKLPVLAIAKGPTRKEEKLFFSGNFSSKLKQTFLNNKRMIKLIRDEAHRFAINYHRYLRKTVVLN